MSVGSALGASKILSNALSTPPGSPSDGDGYIVASSPTGAWSGKENYIARWNATTSLWDIEFPVVGLQQYVVSQGKVFEWQSPDGTAAAATSTTAATGWQPASCVRSSAFPYLTLAQLDSVATAMGVPLEFDISDIRTALSTNVNTVLTTPLVRFTGGVFTLSGGATLHINAIEAGELQCFDVTNVSTSGVEFVIATSINVKWFGALGDGATDDSLALQAAINCALKFSPLGGEVYVPPGEYMVGTQLMATPFVAAQGFALRGAGGRSSILTANSSLTSGALLYVGALSGKKYDGISIVDMGFQSAGTETFLVNLDFNRDAIVDRCAFIGGNNIQLYVGSPQGQQICNCDFFGSSVTTTGIYIGNNPDAHPGQALRINNCIIRDFRNSSGTAIGVTFTTGSEMAIVDCDIENNDCSINVDAGRTEVVRNSFESGSVLRGISYASGNASTHNTGDGFLEPDLFVPVDVNASIGVYKVACTGVVAGVATFAVTDPSNAAVSTLTVSTDPVTFGQQIYFTLYPGDVAFVSGDSFTVNVLNKPAIGTVTYSGTGTNTLTMDATQPVIAGALLGNYLITCTDDSASPQVFTVTDPLGAGVGAQFGNGTYEAGTTFADGIQFVIATGGGTPYMNGDQFTVPVTALATFATTGYAPSVAANPGTRNTGNGTVSAVTPLTGVQSGIYSAVALTATTFDVRDTAGTSIGTATAGVVFNAAQISFMITAGGTAFVAGDSFQFNMLGDVMVKLGRNDLAASIICADNTMSGDGVLNQRFFDLYLYREIFIDRNVFITLTSNDLGKAVWLSPVNAFRNSYLRWNSGAFDPRTNIAFDPALPDGSWVIYGNSEGGNGNSGSDSAPLGATAPLVTNLDTLYFENTSATAISAFQRGYDGQMLTVLGNETSQQTTLKNGASIRTISGGDEPIYGGAAYTFRATAEPGSTVPVWYQTGPVFYTPMDPATIAYLGAGTSAGAPALPLYLQRAVDKLVFGLKTSGLWTTFDGFWLTAVNDIRLATVNLIAPGTNDLAASGTLLFSAYNGITSNGSSYANTAIIRNGSGQYQLNSGSLTVWSPVASSQTTYAIGTSTGAVARIAPHQASKIVGRVNDGSSISIPSTDGGLSTISRTASGARATYRNALQIGQDAQPSTSLGTDVFHLLNDGAVFHTLNVSMAAIGAGRTAAQEATLYYALLPYMQAIYLA